jgi:hypothetical protein
MNASFLRLPPAVPYAYFDFIPNPEETEGLLQESAGILFEGLSFREGPFSAAGE